jgi:DNA-3-methyladenine glycosylase II
VAWHSSEQSARGERIEVAQPFRLDLTVAALQRLPENPVDVWRQGRYLRAWVTPGGPVIWDVRPEGNHLRLSLAGPMGRLQPWRELAARMLGTGVDLAPFHARAARIPQVAPLVRAFRGLRPPRFASLWESFALTVLFQQLSLQSAMATVRRLVLRFAPPIEMAGETLRPFPEPGVVANASEPELRRLGMSGAKARTLRDIAAAIAGGELREERLERLPTERLRERLLAIRGIGPWTASLLLLRGFRRLEVFPAGDVGVGRGLSKLLGSAEPGPVLEALGPWRGMLYFHFLLETLAARREGPFAHGEVPA